MPSPSKKNTISQSTTQLFLDLYDITNDLIILGDGAASLVISVSAMNFGLLSENEQDATIYAYAALLNSLSFPIEIVIRSQPKDVTGYLKRIQDQEQRTTNPIYRQKIQEYRTFVESLVQDQNVLDKKFYIVIPLSAVEMGLTTQSVVPGAKSKSISSFEKNYIIEKAKTNLIPRKDHLIDQLARIGLYSRQLNTQELIQMLYSSYNPESFEGQKVTDTSNYTTPLVQAKIQGDFMADMNTIPTPAGAPSVQTPPAPTMSAPVAPTAPTPAMSTTNMAQPMMTPSMPSPTPAPVIAPAPAMPEFAESPLGFATPPQMSSFSPEPPAEPAMTPPPVTTAMAPEVTPTSMMTPPTPVMSSAPTSVFQSTPTPSTGIAESPLVSVPSEKPVVADLQADPQSLINQTIGQLKSPLNTSMPDMSLPVNAPAMTPTMNPVTMPSPVMPGMPTTGSDLPTPVNPMMAPKIDN